MPGVTQLVVPKSMKLPDRLYHYTSQQGLIGILSSHTLWSTRIQYLNDSTEFRYTLGLLQKAIQVRRERAEATKSILDLKPFLDIMEKGFESLHRGHLHLHVACFSEGGDILNLWRGYCPPGSRGFSIGFDEGQLCAAASSQRSFLAPCIYDPEKQSQLVDHLIDDFFNQAIKIKEKGLDTKGMGHDFFMDCIFLASVLKHPSFGEESEWRLVTGPFHDNHKQFSVRQGKIIPIPYFRFELIKPTEQLDVAVVVGPTPEAELSMDSVRTLMKIHDCVGTVAISAVPYREI